MIKILEDSVSFFLGFRGIHTHVGQMHSMHSMLLYSLPPSLVIWVTYSELGEEL